MPSGLLLPLFQEEAARRGVLARGAMPTPAQVFQLVRDMPYQRATSREPEVTVREWRGTCSGKHYLLKALFEATGFDVRLMVCPHVFTSENSVHFPPSLREELALGPVPDVHNFIRVNTRDGWMDVDATWPLEAGQLGFPVNEGFHLGVSMRVACEPLEILEAPGSADPQRFKEEVIRRHCGAQSQRRNRFIEDLSKWIVQGLYSGRSRI
jgi:hypothetical protein